MMSLYRLPEELHHMIYDYLNNTDDPKSIHIHYRPGRRLSYRDIYNMLFFNKLINSFVTTWLYGAHELFFDSPTNDLPLFISRVRPNTLGKIKKIKLQYDWDQNLTLGLRLLPCCKELRSLKIASKVKFPKYHFHALKQLRLENFEYDGPRIPEMEKIRGTILSRKEPKGRLLRLSLEQILEWSELELYVKKDT